ncbi:MAG TPA: hypothetical protein PKE26_01765 [Kiritimatiellia bacterium]|nr:hypothetical protein [Kiritimatiellia bacterium]HMO97816.1 hypothetical protein [Kiritimatiellia bacterium]HMP96437.1 hypothetical protein [Kiritimatiellia bacterium]
MELSTPQMFPGGLRFARLLPALLLALVMASSAMAEPAEPSRRRSGFDFGPFISRHQDVNGDWRLKILGPLYEQAESGDGMRLDAVRPLYSTVEDPTRDRALTDVVWPLATSRTVRDENQWRYLFFFGFNHTTNDPGQRYRTWLIPFYFQGRDAEGKTYRALFPVGGTIKDFVGRDEISFVLFPLYSTSALNDLSTVNVLWPFISRTRSERDHIYRARVFPFYGVNRHRDKFDKRFILWPIYTEVHYQYPKGHGKGHMVFPLYGRLDLDTEKTWWVVPPLVRFTRGENMNITYAPWPFYQRRVGAGIDQRYLWPLWGKKVIDDLDTRFYLWPIFWTERDRRPGQTVERVLVVPFFSHTAVRADTSGATAADAPPEVLARRHKFWPLYSYRRVEEASHLRLVELWPFADTPSVERNWAPLWSLYTRSARGADVDHEALWGVFRHQRRGDDYRYVSLFPLVDVTREEAASESVRSWNLLKGLVGYERKGSRKSIRLLYFVRIGIGKESPP